MKKGGLGAHSPGTVRRVGRKRAYTGGSLGRWHSASNWSCNEVPDCVDSVDIAAGDNISVAAAAPASKRSYKDW